MSRGEMFPGEIERAVVLAAGRGRRMGELTAAAPKPLLPIDGQPMLLLLLSALAAAGLRTVEMVTGYRAEELEAAVEEAPVELSVRFHRQRRLDGTAGALLLCREACGEEPFLLSWADVLAEPSDYRALIDRYRGGGGDQVLGVNPVDDPTEGAAVYVDDGGLVERILEKPPPGTSTARWNNAGVFVFGPAVFDYAAQVEPSSRGERELPSAIAAMLADGCRFAAEEIAGWRHVGTPEELESAQRGGRR